ncbi:MAG: hypothetical protein ABW022_13420 [Actinoplanes sp.]
MPAAQAKDVIDGVIPDEAPQGLLTALRAVARLTEQMREREPVDGRAAEYFAGRVKEVHEHYVLLVLMSGPETLIPRWMAAGAANRAHVGSFLALITDKLNSASAVIDVIPALDVNDDLQPVPFSPFSRNDDRALAITAEDERLLSGHPEPPRVLVPVIVEP